MKPPLRRLPGADLLALTRPPRRLLLETEDLAAAQVIAPGDLDGTQAAAADEIGDGDGCDPAQPRRFGLGDQILKVLHFISRIKS